ncbi:MAG: hypothetical protein WCO13_14680, partial [Bacteroidota bacterium]
NKVCDYTAIFYGTLITLGFPSSLSGWGGAINSGLITAAVKSETSVVEEIAVHGNSLKSTRPTWGYKLYSNSGKFLKNGITSAEKAEARYPKSFMQTHYMEKAPLFPNRRAAFNWEFIQNQIERGPLNKNMH